MGQQQTKEFSLLSWNIFGLDDNYISERTHAVCELVKQKKPDVVYFQEAHVAGMTVIPATWDLIMRELGGEYTMYRNVSGWCNYYHDLMVRNGSAVVPTKDGSTAVTFPGSGQGRHLLKLPATIHGSSTGIHFMTSHLENLPTDTEERKYQLKQGFDVMKELEKASEMAIFGGDLNIEDRELAEIGGQPENIRDVWEVYGSEN